MSPLSSENSLEDRIRLKVPEPDCHLYKGSGGLLAQEQDWILREYATYFLTLTEYASPKSSAMLFTHDN